MLQALQAAGPACSHRHAHMASTRRSRMHVLAGTTSEVLSRAGINAPSTQALICYIFLAAICTSVFFTQTARSLKPVSLNNPWYVYAGIAVLDVEGNYLLVKAYQFTSITSVTLLDSATIPLVMLLSIFIFR
jgi:solute carrier family 35 protein F1/2